MSVFTAGVIGLAVLAVAVYFGFTKAIPFGRHFEVTAVFKTANNLRLDSPVRIAGVTVGKVTKVEHASDGGEEAIVTMRLDDRGRPIHKDARLAIRPRIFLEGNFFIDVEPGTPSQPELEDGDVIPVNQTRTPVQFDQLLTALQSDTREDLQVLLREYASALRGSGARGYNRSLPWWEPAYRDSAIVADATLGQAEHDLSGYVKNAGAVAQALDRNPEKLKSLITDFHVMARAFAREHRDLRRAVSELPRTLRAAQPALGSLNDAFPSLRAFARDLEPGVRSSGPAIDAALPLVRELRRLVSEDELEGLLRDLSPTVPALAEMTATSVPLYREVRRASSCQNEVVLPWTHDTVPDPVFPAQGKVYEEAPKPLPGLSGESRSGDGNGQWFRILSAGGNNLITLRPGVFATSALPIEGVRPRKPTKRPPLRSDVPCETQERPDLRSAGGPAPPQRRLDTTSPRYVKRLARDKAAAVRWLKRQVKYEGLADEIRVSDEYAPKATIDAIAKRTRAEQAARRQQILRRFGR